MNIAIYARVSSETQAKEGTIQSQLEALREYAKAESHQIIAECIDDGYSGAELNRPGLDTLRDIVSEGLVESVLLLTPDRLSRKQAHQIILLEEFKKHNVKVIFTNQPSGETAEDQLMLNIQGAISEYERAKILDRTRRGTKHAVKNGQVIGSNPPYGYCFVKKTKDHPATYAIDEQEAETVRTIFDWYLKERLKGPSIAKRLEQEGMPSRSQFNKWWTSSVYAILKNETYTGTAYMYKTKAVEPSKHAKLERYRQRQKSSKADRPREDWLAVSVPPIIDKATWQKAQEQLKRNAQSSPRNNKKHTYMLRGLVVCGLCGSMAPGHVSNGYTYYCCGAKRNKNLTTKPHDERVAVRHSKLDEKVWSGLVQLLDNSDSLKAQLERKLERMNQPVKVDKSNLYKVEQELDKLAQQEKRLLDAYREGIIDLDELREQKAKVAKRLHVAKAKQRAIQSAQEGSGTPNITMSELVDLSAVYKRAMSKADASTKQTIANLLINRVKLYPAKALVEGVIPLDRYALNPSKHAAPTPLSLRERLHVYPTDRSNLPLIFVDERQIASVAAAQLPARADRPPGVALFGEAE